MNILFADTSSRILTVGAVFDGRLVSRSFDAGKSGHTALLMPTLDEILRECGAKPVDFGAVGVVTGPGAFTGIRIGAATATAVTFATGAKRVAVTAFEPIAYNRGAVNAAIDAGRGNVYAARCEDGQVKETFFLTAEEYAEASARGEKFCTEPVGDVAETLAAIVNAKAERGDFVSVFEPFYMRKPQAERNLQ